MNVHKLTSPAAWLEKGRQWKKDSGIWARKSVSVLSGDRVAFGENSRRIQALKQKHAGQRAVIIGNGPSLRIADLDRLQNEFTFAANKIFLAFDQTRWRPTYYNVEDPLVIQQTHQRVNALKGFQKLLKRYEGAKYWVADEYTVFYDLLVLPREKFPQFSPSPHRGLFCGYSVCVSSMQWAWFMGFREIYLIGVDFSFIVPNSDKNGTIRSENEVNHFVPNYRTPGEKWQVPNLEDQLKAFEKCRDWLAARGVKVFNATRGGKLEVFPRASFEDLF